MAEEKRARTVTVTGSFHVHRFLLLSALSHWERVGVRAYGRVDPN
jgi:hypothetical protein